MISNTNNTITKILIAFSWALLSITGYFLIDRLTQHPYGKYKIVRIDKDISALDAESALVFFKGWSFAEPTHRWTNSKTIEIKFQLDSIPSSCNHIHFNLYPLYVAEGTQLIKIKINGTALGDFEINASDSIISVPIDAKLYYKEYANLISIYLPNAKRNRDLNDSRILGIGITKLSFKCF